MSDKPVYTEAVHAVRLMDMLLRADGVSSEEAEETINHLCRGSASIAQYKMENELAELAVDKLCMSCPAGKDYSGDYGPDLFWSNEQMDPCRVCLEFLGLRLIVVRQCPCQRFGKEEARRRSLEQLRAKGYI